MDGESEDEKESFIYSEDGDEAKNKNRQNTINKVVLTTQPNNKNKISANVTDEEFKANYSQGVLKRQSTLTLKTSFHLVNLVLMGICQVFKNI